MDKEHQHIYKTGTLSYTKKGLGILFFWLMCGDFCYTMEFAIDPAVLPFMMTKLKAPNTLISLLIITIPAFLNFILNPIISTTSDRYRSKWGRRIPFLMLSVPSIAITLILTGYAPQIGIFLQNSFGISKTIPVALDFLCAITVLYRISHLLVGTSYYYLFNDVVPEEVMGRFTTGFKVFGVVATSIFSLFGFRYIESHPQYVCMAAALIYVIGFGFLCFNVKEGKYPPASDSMNAANPFKIIATYARECFCHRIYIYYFLSYSFFALFMAANSFVLLMQNKSMGVSLEYIGIITAVTLWVSLAAIIPGGFLMDKFHPIRVCIISVAILVIIYPALIAWAFIQKSGNMIPFCICLNLITGILFGLAQTSLLPLGMRIFPRSQYGQFSSASAMLSSLFLMGAGFLIGHFLDVMKNLYHGNLFYYRWALIWGPSAFLITLLFLFVTYNTWKKMGGDEGYVAPQRL